MNRRVFTSLLGAAPAAFVKAAQPRQNILFVAIDDLNDWIGCLNGYPGVLTPNLDKVAARGTLFRSAHCAAPLCNPARTAIMTGRRPASTGVYDNNQPYHGSKVLKGAVTLNQHMVDNGYLAFGAGKIYHGTRGAFADMKGWTEYGDPKGAPELPGPLPLAGPAGLANMDWGAVKGGDETMNDYHVVDWVSRHLAAKQTQPMFLACGIYRPHLPWYVPKKYFDLYPLDAIRLPVVKEDDLDDVPETGRRMARQNNDHPRITKNDAWKRAVQAYLASITFADTMVGRLMRALENGPHAGNTSIVLWSDHGWHLGEKLHWRKFTLWERSTRNVLMINARGVSRPGSTCDRTVSMVDLYPTLMDMTGLKAPGTMDGQSLMPLLRNPAAGRTEPALTTFRFGNHAVRTEGWRYIRYNDGGEELYDRTADPNEWTNLAASPAQAARKAELARWLPAHNEPNAPVGRGTGEERENN